MIVRYWINTVAVSLLTSLFYNFFMFTKHDTAMTAIVPFGEDPWDAVGSYCLIVSILLAILSLIRTLRPTGIDAAASRKTIFLTRTQIAIPVGILLTLLTDAVAMARHPSRWMSQPGAEKLLGMIVGLAAICLAAIYVIRRIRVEPGQIEEPERKLIRQSWTRAWITLPVCVVIFAVYPEGLIESIPFHFLTIVAGFILIAAPQSALVMAILPPDRNETGNQSSAPSRQWLMWIFVSVFGIVVGVLAFLPEFFGENHGQPPLSQAILVASIFTGAGLGLILSAFAFLRRPLGLFARYSDAVLIPDPGTVGTAKD